MENKEIFKKRIKDAVVEQLAKSLIAEEVMVSFKEEIVKEFKDLYTFREILPASEPIKVNLPAFSNSALDNLKEKKDKVEKLAELQKAKGTIEQKNITLVDRILNVKYGLSTDRIKEIIRSFEKDAHLHLSNSSEDNLDKLEDNIKNVKKNIEDYVQTLLNKQKDIYELSKLSEGNGERLLMLGKNQHLEIRKLREIINKILDEDRVVLNYSKYQNGKNFYIIAEASYRQQSTVEKKSSINFIDLLSQLGDNAYTSVPQKEETPYYKNISKILEDTNKEFNLKMSVVYNDLCKSYYIDTFSVILNGCFVDSTIKSQEHIIDIPFAVSVLDKINFIVQNRKKDEEAYTK